jgi:hypothetical protein
MEMETPLVLSGLSKFLKPLIYAAIVPYAWMAVSNAAGPAAACALTALIAGPLTIKAVVRWINYRDTRQRLTDSSAPDGHERLP